MAKRPQLKNMVKQFLSPVEGAPQDAVGTAALHTVNTAIQQNRPAAAKQIVKVTFYLPADLNERFDDLYIARRHTDRKLKKTALAAEVFGRGVADYEKELADKDQ